MKVNSLFWTLCFTLFTWLISFSAEADETSEFHADVSGYVKSLNFLTQTSGLNPEVVDMPMLLSKENTVVFNSLERFRLKLKATYDLDANGRIVARTDYDHQPYFGNFVDTDDFRIAHRQTEERQFLDLSQTLIEDDAAFYEHRLYRASIAYETKAIDIEAGRQLIPWGKGHFFTPTDLLNPFNPTQIELLERDGVDAVSVRARFAEHFNTQLIYTPGGGQLHPQRYLARIARDVKGFEVGVLGGRIKRDHAIGFDWAGNIKTASLRGEFLYREAATEKDFIKFTVNIDYNFPHNLYALLEYHYNGQGRDAPQSYQLDRLIRGEIQQLGKSYLATAVGYDLTPLLRFENRAIVNIEDTSVFVRPELQYEIRPNVLLTAGAQLFAGANDDEYGRPKNLYLAEAKYDF